MSKKLYLDGCSYTYGLGLEKRYTLESLFADAGYEVTNMSRPGKSNMAIALDTFNNSSEYDTYVLGFTYSSRYYLKFNDIDIDLLNTRFSFDKADDADIEQAYLDIHKSFYTLFDSRYWGNISDMLIETTIANLESKSKKVFALTWEPRNTSKSLYFPVVLPTDRLPDGHLNSIGTQKLFDKIQNLLGDA